MTFPRILEPAVTHQIATAHPPGWSGKRVAPGNTIWDLTHVNTSPAQSLAIWRSSQPMPPHRCMSDMWYACLDGMGQLFIEPADGSHEPIGHYFGEDDYFQKNDAILIPAGRWCFTIPSRTFTSRILNQPAFEPHHFLAMSRDNTNDLEVIDYFESTCHQLGWPQLASTP